MVITANDIAALAILTTMGGVLLTNRHQRVMARQQYLLDHRTDTYLKVLKEVRRQDLMVAREAAPFYPVHEFAVGVIPFELSAEDTTALTGHDLNFSAEVTAFASPAVVRRWLDFQTAATDCRAYARELQSTDKGGAQLEPVTGAERLYRARTEYSDKRGDLIEQIRFELETSRTVRLWPVKRRQAHPADNPDLNDVAR